MKQPSSITSLPASPDAERRARVIKYSIMMSIRVLCVVALLFARGPWLWVFAAGAIVLPYIAVVVANVKISPRSRTVLRPGSIELAPRSDDGTTRPGDDE
ncbi:DUF3099 domain-containing protein [Leifsonia sp. YIM 134122]|uniref:DUF3099 domain-containing protein n=1 Tax=Leifsonia stereocauli TaxID=3134136 RepID=A0ABU9W241_9MICO